MTRFMVLVYEDEAAWNAATVEQADEAMTARDYRFGELLEQRGHKIVGGAALTTKRDTAVVRHDTEVTLGPWAESVEQLGGFYLVEGDDLDTVVELAAVLTPPVGELPARIVEVRAVAMGGGDEPES